MEVQCVSTTFPDVLFSIILKRGVGAEHKKDPGIPNNFPYKDQILAEVAEERRKAEEAKQKKKDMKKALKAGTAQMQAVDVSSDREGSESGIFDGMGAVVGVGTSKQTPAGKSVVEDKAEEDALTPMNSEFSSLKEVLEVADVVVEVLDARDPLVYHSSHLVELVRAKEKQKLLLVLNKIGECVLTFTWKLKHTDGLNGL